MYDEYGPGPIDSYDCYAMGLRAARCTGCEYEKLRWEMGDKFYSRHVGPGLINWLRGRYRLCAWVEVYELNARPNPGQRKKKHRGRSIRHLKDFASMEHSDECYHWSPPEEDKHE